MIDWWKSPSDLARFKAKIKRAGADQCWEWQAYRRKDGYGIFQLGNKPMLSHRLALAAHLGRALERDELALHSCDNPPCVNPVHLRVGTDADNVRDRDERQRRRPPQGIRNGRAQLTESEVREIRALAAAGGDTHKEIGRRFGVAKATITHIHTRYTWSHLK